MEPCGIPLLNVDAAEEYWSRCEWNQFRTEALWSTCPACGEGLFSLVTPVKGAATVQEVHERLIEMHHLSWEDY